MDKTYRYLGYFFLLLIPLVYAGFYKSYFRAFPHAKNIHVFDNLHALVASAWILLLIVQPFLIAKKKKSLHRRLGRISYVIFPLLITSFIPQIMKMIRTEDIRNLFFPVADCVLLILFYALAIHYRKQTSGHMRYMIASALVLLGPTWGRMGSSLFGLSDLATQNIQYAIIYAILGFLIFYDRRNHRPYQPYLVAVAGFALHQAVYYLVFL